MNLRCLLWWRRKRSVRSDDCGADLHSLALLSPKEQPRRRRWHPIQCSCLENPRDRGACWAAVHEVAKSRTRLSGFTFTFHFHAPEKEMAPHSSVLAWRIPGMGEPGGLPSMGSHRVGHDWSDLAAAARSSLDFTGVSAAKDLPAKQETCVWALDQEDLLREGNGNPLQYSCLGKAMDRGARRVTVHGAPKSLPTTSVNRISETWAVRSPSPGTKGRRRRGGATSALCPVSSASGKYVCLLSTKRHPEFLLQSGPQHWLGEPGLACPAPRLPPLHGCALSHSGTKWNIRVLHTSQGSPPA